MGGPESEAAWYHYIEEVHRHLGLKPQIPHVATLFQSVNEL